MKPLARRRPSSPGREASWLTGGITVLLLAEHLALGMNTVALSLLSATLHGGVLLGLMSRPWARATVATRWRSLARPGAPLAAVLAAGLFSVSPWAPPVALNGLAVSGSVDPQGTVVEVTKLAGLACLFTVALVGASQPQGARTLRRALRITAVLFAIYALGQRLFFPTKLLAADRFTALDRLTADFVSANTAGALFGVLTCLALAAFLDRLRRSRGFPLERLQEAGPAALPLLLLAGCLVMTASRSAVLATVAAVSLQVAGERAASRRRRGLWRGRALLSALAVLLLALAGAGAGLYGRLGDTADAGVERLAIYAAHAEAAVRHPWFGYGLGSFRRVNLAIISSSDFSTLYDLGAAHDVYLQWFEQAGVVGGAAIAACIAVLLRAVAVRARGWGPDGRFARAVMGASALLLIQGVSDYALETPSIAATWTVLLAAVVAVPSRTLLGPRRRRHQPPAAPEITDAVSRGSDVGGPAPATDVSGAAVTPA